MTCLRLRWCLMTQRSTVVEEAMKQFQPTSVVASARAWAAEQPNAPPARPSPRGVVPVAAPHPHRQLMRAPDPPAAPLKTPRTKAASPPSKEPRPTLAAVAPRVEPSEVESRDRRYLAKHLKRAGLQDALPALKSAGLDSLASLVKDRNKIATLNLPVAT